MAETVIQLSRHYDEVPGEIPFNGITLREPTYREIFMDGLGKPYEFQLASNGVPVRMVFPEVIDRYLQKIVVKPAYSVLYCLSARDSLKLEQAVCDFFREPVDTKPSQTSSSSATDGTQTASSE